MIIKKKKEANYGIMNDVMYEWYIKCCLAGVYPDGALLQEEALKIKTKLNYSSLGDFKVSNGWFKHFKKCFDLKQIRIVAETGVDSRYVN